MTRLQNPNKSQVYLRRFNVSSGKHKFTKTMQIRELVSSPGLTLRTSRDKLKRVSPQCFRYYSHSRSRSRRNLRRLSTRVSCHLQAVQLWCVCAVVIIPMASHVKYTASQWQHQSSLPKVNTMTSELVHHLNNLKCVQAGHNIGQNQSPFPLGASTIHKYQIWTLSL